MKRIIPALVLFLLAFSSPAWPQTISGRLFEDRNGNGLWDTGEPFLNGIPVGLFGTDGASLPVDATTTTGMDGSYSFTPGSGCFLVDLADPVGWRPTPPRADRFPETAPGYTFPVGQPRHGKLSHGVNHLRSGALRYVSMGDSIAWNFNVCNYPESFWYSKQVQSRLSCAAPGATVLLDQAAVKGEHTDDLLVEDFGELNNVFRMIRPNAGEDPPDLITLSMIGNDLLNVDLEGIPSQSEINRAVEEILDARRNLQEVFSALVSELPETDIGVNTLYDNLAYNCPSIATSPFHREWVPIMDQLLRDLAWGQIRPVAVYEVAADFGQEGLGGLCGGFEGLVCRDLFGFDRIHPDNDGYQVVREKVWEGIGGVTIGSQDVLQRPLLDDVDFGFLRKVRRLFPSSWETRNGALVTDPEAALFVPGDGLATDVTLGVGEEEFRVAGFPAYFDEIRIVRVVAGIRYRTAGTVTDDFYRIEASTTGLFEAPPGYSYTPTNWNIFTPLVGAGGPNQPAANADYPEAALLVLPEVPQYRQVSATLSTNPILPPGGEEYSWPSLTMNEIATTAIRVVAAPVAATPGNDAYSVKIDTAWLDLYGWEKPRPGEVANLNVDLEPDGTLVLNFAAIPGAQRYNLYIGRLASLQTGHDHGSAPPSGPFCSISTEDAGGGQLRISLASSDQPAEPSYFYVTAHVDDVESPTGHNSSGIETDRSQSVCP